MGETPTPPARPVSIPPRPPDPVGLRADRDALLAEVRQLRSVVDAITRALGELKQAPAEAPSDEVVSRRELRAEGEPATQDDATRVFGAVERELVRSLGRACAERA